ncbi:hypothetical protein [Polaribacter sp.]|uniref:hypothetical protein n=1 Tax=Polaribacter sp. TaxID=1920175 RepID=UPI0025EB2585|nr:hypothetical protein [Polaribacter sp.]
MKSTYTQNKKYIITGKVTDSVNIIKNANIINLNTYQGTFSSDEGLYRIFVSKGDTLRVSSIQFEPKKILITEKIIDARELDIILKTTTYTLNEFELKRNNLLGRLGIDTKDVPRNKQDSLLRRVMDFSNVNFKEKDFTIDEISKAKPPIVNTMGGAIPMAGAGAKAVIPFKNSARLWALRSKLEQKKQFPYKVLSELGEKFFFDELKIPIDNYFHFLEYCNPLSIENLHKDGRLLELIKILRAESKPYLKLIKKE